MIAFTCDIDWAPEEVISDTISIFEEYDVKCTFFCTHESAVIRSCNRELFELGIHPNFNPCLNGKAIPAEQVFDEIMDLFPEAVGVRSHSMTQSTPLLKLFADKGLLYEANHFLPYHNHLRAFRLWNGLIRIPYCWEDDIHFMYGHSYDELKIDLSNEDTLMVLDFHPIHIYTNTSKQSDYDKIRPFYHEPEKLYQLRNRDVLGVRDLLLKTLDYVKGKNLRTMKMLEIAKMV